MFRGTVCTRRGVVSVHRRCVCCFDLAQSGLFLVHSSFLCAVLHATTSGSTHLKCPSTKGTSNASSSSSPSPSSLQITSSSSSRHPPLQSCLTSSSSSSSCLLLPLTSSSSQEIKKNLSSVSSPAAKAADLHPHQDYVVSSVPQKEKKSASSLRKNEPSPGQAGHQQGHINTASILAKKGESSMLLSQPSMVSSSSLSSASILLPTQPAKSVSMLTRPPPPPPALPSPPPNARTPNAVLGGVNLPPSRSNNASASSSLSCPAHLLPPFILSKPYKL